MGEHLWPLLRLKAETEEQEKAQYRDVFVRTYVRDASGAEVALYDWNGQRVRFSDGVFSHAFSEGSDYRFRPGFHDKPFSKDRARRVLWIKEVLQASRGTIERRQQMRKDSRGRATKRRILLVVEECYVVVLEERKNPGAFWFLTAFPADQPYVEKIRRESTFLESKKPQS